MAAVASLASVLIAFALPAIGAATRMRSTTTIFGTIR
jgi:hypothetical protein